MKRFISATILLACLVALTPVASAQDCSTWTNWDLRGTYAISGSGWISPAQLSPALPAALVPLSWVGLQVWDGQGGASGWLSLNAGGMQAKAQFVDTTYSVQPDCSIQATFSMKVDVLGGAVVGPYSRIFVIAGDKEDKHLELKMMFIGAGAGTSVDLGTARRVWKPRFYTDLP